jgi:pimeloyl-ACP methyl ester carboxylesterase
VEYPGYGPGQNRGEKPSLEGAVEAVLQVYLKLAQSGPVVLVGRSIGTGIAAQVAKHLKERALEPALVLISPFRSVNALVPLESSTQYCIDLYNTEAIIPQLTSPLLIFHGSRDDLIPCSHSHALYEQSPAKEKRFELLKGDTHNRLNWDKIALVLLRWLPKAVQQCA